MQFPHEISGWLTVLEGTSLAELATGKHVLEIGSYCGRSTICMAQTALSVWSVDPHDGRATPNERDTYAEFLANVARYGLTNVNSVRGVVHAGLEFPCKFGLVFVDGDHTLPAVRNDIAIALSLLDVDGRIAFHDYRTSPGEYDGRWDAGVTEAVDDFIANGAKLISRHGTVAVVQPLL
jgi:predicted O-methyltransferase YrrM